MTLSRHRRNGIQNAGGTRFIRGDVGFSRLIRRLPDSAREEMGGILSWAGGTLRWMMQGDTPVKTGALRNAITWRLAAKTLRLRVGIIGKALNRRLYYRWIIERGRYAQTVRVRRLRRGGREEWRKRIRASNARLAYKPADLVTAYDLNVKRRAPHPFVFKKRPEFRRALNERLRTFWEKTLAAAGEGIGLND